MNEKEINSRIYSIIKNFIQKRDWINYDNFAEQLSDKIFKELKKGNFEIDEIIRKQKATFFKYNNISKEDFINSGISTKIYDFIADVEIDKEKGNIRILFLSSNPTDTAQLRLGEEARAIDKAIRSSDLRDIITIYQQWEVRLSELQEHFLRYRPNIIHFSGHSSDKSEIILIDEYGTSIAVPPKALENLFKIFKDQIQIVFLNACFSEKQAEAIAKHIPYVIGMSEEVLDRTAIKFAGAFYLALGYGETVETAFDLAINKLDLESIPGSHIPVLIIK